MSDHRLLGICGALRAGSTNRKLLNEAKRLFDPADYAEANLRLPLYDGDLQDKGIPDEVTALTDQIAEADAVVISTPEYNKALPGVLKNALDWVSVTGKGPWKDKPVAIISAAAGRAGGERSQYSLRHCMTPFRPRILQGPEVMVANSSKAFDENGHLTDDKTIEFLQELMDLLKAEIGR